MEKEVEAYLKADRQWLRVHRITHAQYQLAHSTSPLIKEFFKKVLEANGADA